MGVSPNATATASIFVSGTSPITFSNLTIAAGSNIALAAGLDNDGASGGLPPGLAVTWNGVALTQLVTVTSGAGSVAGYGLRNPATGNQTLSISWTGGSSQSFYVDAMAFNGVDQASDSTAFPVAGRVTNNGASTALSLTITSSPNNYCFQMNGLNNSQHRTANSDTELFYNTAGGGNAEAQYGVGSASKTMTLTLDSASAWGSVGFDIAAVAAVIAESSGQVPRRAGGWRGGGW